jgi:hypothetical protein
MTIKINLINEVMKRGLTPVQFANIVARAKRDHAKIWAILQGFPVVASRASKQQFSDLLKP